MKTAKAKITEILLDGSLQIDCSPEMIPSSGQYLLAHNPASNTPLPVSIFPSITTPNGFRSAPLHTNWQPADSLILRGPIGHGFQMPASAKKIALLAFENSYATLQGLISIALKQNAEIVLLSDLREINLPEIIEVQPLRAAIDIFAWADYVAIDIARENLPRLKEILQKQKQVAIKYEAQVLIHAPMSCGGLAECGLCALHLNHEWKMICKEGPVFNLSDVL
jgi:NAD(P)H-flavin reductase